MAKIVVLVLLLAAAVRGNRAREVADCAQRPDGGTPLFFKLKTPVKEHGRAVRAMLHAQFPCLAFQCTRGGGMFAYIHEDEAEQLLGKHAVFTTVKGAGNNVNTDAYFAEVKPASFVPAALKAHVERVTFNDDPKFMYTGPQPKPCQ